MSVDAKGPIFAAGTEAVTQDGYIVLFLPDVNNDFLQREGKPPVYHWLPNSVRLAQKPNGDYKFSFIHFVGVRSGETTVGAHDTDEVAGGLFGFSTTAAFPAAVLEAAEQQLLNRFRGSDQNYWGWRVPAAPMFRPAPIVSNTTTITNLGPTSNGTVPSVQPPAGGGKAIGAPLIRATGSIEPRTYPPTVPRSRGFRDSNLDPWYVNLQGQGPGSITPMSENAYSGLVGSLPAALIWASFHGGMTPISVWQNQRIKVWAPLVEIWIDGNWSRIQDHFSAAAHAGGWFWSADIQAEFNSMRIAGDIQVQISIDPTIPGGDKISEQIDKRSDLVFQKFMEEAQKVIFDPPPYNEKPAEASGGFLGLGGGAAFKLRRDQTNLSLHYHEKREMAYLQENQVSGQLEGLYDQLKADPSAEKKYFINLFLEDWDRKVSRVYKPVVNWPDASRKWVGEPVAFLSVQVGYPDTQGAVQWDGHVFEPSAGPDAKWTTQAAMKQKTDVTNPPADWEPAKTFLKRKIHFNEPPSESENDFVRMYVEKNEVDLDPGPNGTVTDEINGEVRVDSVGALNVGPIFLGVDLEGPKQIVEITFQAEGKDSGGNDRPPVKFSWNADNQTEPRYWTIFTGQPDFVPKYKYQVRVVVKGSIMTHGMEWVGPWTASSGNGPLMARVPTSEEEGVTIVSRTTENLAKDVAVVTRPGMAATGAAAAGGRPSTPPPPYHGRGVVAIDSKSPTADNPFDVEGFQPRDVSADQQKEFQPASTGTSSTGMPSAKPAGQPPAVASKSRGTSAGDRKGKAVVGGYSVVEELTIK